MPKKILITGGAGFLGGRAAKHFASIPDIYKVVATSRRAIRRRELENAGCQFREGDLLDIDFCHSITSGVEVVVHCAALSSPWGKYDDFYKSNVKATQNLLKACQNQGVKRFVFIATPSIYFNYKKRLNVKESDPLPSKIVNDYALTKLQAENEVLAANSAKFETLALRPRAIIGAEDTVIFPRVIKAHEAGKLKIVGSGKTLSDLTSVRNVIEAIELAMNSGKESLGRTYNITNDEPIRLWDKVNDVLEALDYPRVEKNVPAAVALLAARIQEWRHRSFSPDKEPELTRYGVGILCKSLTMDITLAKELLSYRPIQTTDEGLQEFVTWKKAKK